MTPILRLDLANLSETPTARVKAFERFEVEFIEPSSEIAASGGGWRCKVSEEDAKHCACRLLGARDEDYTVTSIPVVGAFCEYSGQHQLEFQVLAPGSRSTEPKKIKASVYVEPRALDAQPRRGAVRISVNVGGSVLVSHAFLTGLFEAPSGYVAYLALALIPFGWELTGAFLPDVVQRIRAGLGGVARRLRRPRPW